MRQLLSSLATSAQGMSRQQKFLEIISTNIANAETTRGVDGAPYKRRLGVAETDPKTGETSIRVVEDASPSRSVYDPGHPDANAAGFVEYPNVELNTELVDLMITRRIYEANASVFQAAKGMLKRALEI